MSENRFENISPLEAVRSQRGFSIVELLVTMFLSSVLLGSIATSLANAADLELPACVETPAQALELLRPHIASFQKAASEGRTR